MRLVSFLVLSLVLHAAALAFPLSFGAPSEDEIMRVTILPMEQESIDAGDSGASSPAPRAGSKSAIRPPAAGQPKVEAELSNNPQPQAVVAEAAAKVSNSDVALVSATANSAESHGGAVSVSTSTATYGSGTSTGGIGPGANGSGLSGTGSGSGNGQGSSGNEIISSQARYRETPRPDYPESARREGREGRVLLRVLVDGQGRSKQVEINSSSGSVALDRAAAEAIRRWRFHPARHGDQPVESWLRIPIEFRLDAQSW
jgi:periplasmic protein TonB